MTTKLKMTGKLSLSFISNVKFVHLIHRKAFTCSNSLLEILIEQTIESIDIFSEGTSSWKLQPHTLTSYFFTKPSYVDIE